MDLINSIWDESADKDKKEVRDLLDRAWLREDELVVFNTPTVWSEILIPTYIRMLTKGEGGPANLPLAEEIILKSQSSKIRILKRLLTNPEKDINTPDIRNLILKIRLENPGKSEALINPLEFDQKIQKALQLLAKEHPDPESHYLENYLLSLLSTEPPVSDMIGKAKEMVQSDPGRFVPVVRNFVKHCHDIPELSRKAEEIWSLADAYILDPKYDTDEPLGHFAYSFNLSVKRNDFQWANQLILARPDLSVQLPAEFLKSAESFLSRSTPNPTRERFELHEKILRLLIQKDPSSEGQIYKFKHGRLYILKLLKNPRDQKGAYQYFKDHAKDIIQLGSHFSPTEQAEMWITLGESFLNQSPRSAADIKQAYEYYKQAYPLIKVRLTHFFVIHSVMLIVSTYTF